MIKKHHKLLPFLLLIFILISFIQCKPNKVTSSPVPVAQAVEMDNKNIYPLVVSFYSIGSGIDNEAYQEYMSMIEADYDFITEVVSWGREGEKDVCISLAALNSDSQNTLIQQTEKMLEGKQVHIYKDRMCKKGNP